MYVLAVEVPKSIFLYGYLFILNCPYLEINEDMWNKIMAKYTTNISELD